ncbi:MAG: hypothetical protein CMM58_08325 [Rhodospirillaceae bacterium]|nr:hypothetical protein [Rhodospirillaceae bacterium]
MDAFLARGKKSSSDEVEAFLSNLNTLSKTHSTTTRGRLIFAMDATASREPSWDRACHLQAEMFQEAMSLGGLEVQLAYYRGYGEFKATPWVSNSQALLAAMLKVYCLGGQTQIERLILQAIKETQIKRVQALVFIGDAFEEDIDIVCQVAGQLGVLGVPAFCFLEGNDPIATIGFQQLAKLTNGAYCAFDSGSAGQLKELLKAVAVFAAGGFNELEKYSKIVKGEALRLSHQIKK